MNTIKEAFDNLPIAVCFFDVRGIVRLINRRMLDVSGMLLGRGVQTIYELRAALKEPPAGVTRLDDAMAVYRFPDGTALRFAFEDVMADGAPFTQVTTADVTELVTRQRALRSENERLADANRRTQALLRQMPELVREEEILAMKMRVHDDIGRSILSARRALMQDAGLAEIRASSAAWEHSIELLRRTSHRPPPDDPLSAVEEHAAAVGVKLTMAGVFPDDRERRRLIGAAASECVTNCVRHAGGTEVLISGSAGRVTITNNGAPPDGPVREGGGLSALRRRIEKSGGQMRVYSAPRFALVVYLPEEEDGACRTF